MKTLTIKIAPKESSTLGIFIIKIYPTFKKLNQYARKYFNFEVDGYCVEGEGKVLGHLYLSQDSEDQIIVHECVHAGMIYIRRLGMSMKMGWARDYSEAHSEEEELAECVQYLFEEIAKAKRRNAR